ncbi:unnamed protein product [Paramecium sonneborni]|uniref:Uncharacterized protein n=1 Tax=Paramecium sonneborni TaxID=65129 RepID=A0A8S1RUT0_9CILI|nr:unnamed protein product [Paramecium sonneborni]
MQIRYHLQSTENFLNEQESTEQQTLEEEVDQWNNIKCKLEKTKIQINFTNDHNIIYKKDGTIIRQEQVHNALGKQEILHNMDQIKNLFWSKKYDGKWIVFQHNEILENIGGYCKVGQKQGLWKDLFRNYWNWAQILESGEYQNCFRIGNWNYICQDKKTGGGFYNQDGKKQGKWIELDEGFYKWKQVIYKGEYNKKGLRIGIWDIMYCKQGELIYKQFGGGSYDLKGSQIKIGKWVELDEGFYNLKQATYHGEYDMKGMKVGKWDIMHCLREEIEYKQIGGGSYDQEGSEKKIGKWIELDEEFNDCLQIIYNGDYNKKGIKVGKWAIIDFESKQKLREVNYDN